MSANYRLVANYATSVEYFEKGLYRPNDNVYSCLKVLSNDEERGYGCAGTKPFNQLPRLYLQYSPPEDVAEAVMANPKKQKLVFNRYDVDESGSIDVFEFQKIMKEHLNVSPDEEWFLRNLFSKYLEKPGVRTNCMLTGFHGEFRFQFVSNGAPWMPTSGSAPEFYLP